MSRPKVVYEITHAETGDVLSRHRTRRAAVEAWRTRHVGLPVKIIRWPRQIDGPGVLVADGTWHESHRPDGAGPAE